MCLCVHSIVPLSFPSLNNYTQDNVHVLKLRTQLCFSSEQNKYQSTVNFPVFYLKMETIVTDGDNHENK